MKIRRGDNVIVTAGKDKGKKGKVDRVYPKRNAVLLSGINMYKKHIKKRDEKNLGGIVDIARPIAVSKVALLDPKTKTASRIGYTFIKGSKKRITKKGKTTL